MRLKDVWLTYNELHAIEEAALAMHDDMPISAEHHRYRGGYGQLDMLIKLDYT